MKKRVIFFIIILIMIFVALVIKQSLIKDYGDFKGFLATSRRVSLTVSPFPVISIISPENTTYSTDTILLNYSITNEADSIWYNLDNGINITINSPLQFTTTEGSHILYLYASNIYGTSTKNISFFVDLSTESNPPSSGGGNGGGESSGGITENKTEQQKDNLTTAEETSTNNTEQETPRDITENPEIEPKITEKIIIKFLIILLFLILLILLVIILIITIKKKKRQKKGKAKEKRKNKNQ